MNNTINDLNNYLFEEIERLQDDSLNQEQLDREIERAEAVAKTADAILHNADIQLKAISIMCNNGYSISNMQLPGLLGVSGNAKL